MASIKINRNALEDAITQIMDQSQGYLRPFAREIARVRFQNVKEEMLQEFDNHKVTKEIKGGPNHSEGVLPIGNLFSFLGFDMGTKPTDNLRRVLQNEITLEPTPSYNNRIRRFYFRVNIPSRDSIVEETEDDLNRWGAFDSWVYAIEEGISNINYYLYRKGQILKGSASGPGLQLDNTGKEIHPGIEFGGTPYITEVLDFLRKSISSPVI